MDRHILRQIAGPSPRIHRYLELGRCPWFQPVRTDQPRGAPSGGLHPLNIKDLIADIRDLEAMLQLSSRAYRPKIEL